MGKYRKARLSGAMKARLAASVASNRKKTVYRMAGKRNNGEVPCFVCGRHVKLRHATLEHITPKSKGGTDDLDNLAISHNMCNFRRGNDTDFHCGGAAFYCREVDCCNQPAQCWEPCGDLGKSEAHARPSALKELP